MKVTFFLISVLIFFSCESQTEHNEATYDAPKINGLSLVSMNRYLDSAEMEPIVQTNANYTAVIPFAFMPSEATPGLVFDSKWQWVGERISGAEEAIDLIHSTGLSVMLKPQIWVGHGVFTGKIEMSSDEDWQQLELEYGEYVKTFARIAEEKRVKILCLGTELHRFVAARPGYWKELIGEIREIYSGKLTYAENWDSFSEVPFWHDLDFIGVDAYFPIADGANPSEKNLNDGWVEIEEQLEALSSHTGKKILFTEYGYRSTELCAESPWKYDKGNRVSQQAQWRALNALYNAVWDEPYFAGGFLWKWYPDHENAGGPKNEMFTIQNKKAESLVRKVYGNQ